MVETWNPRETKTSNRVKSTSSNVCSPIKESNYIHCLTFPLSWLDGLSNSMEVTHLASNPETILLYWTTWKHQDAQSYKKYEDNF